MARHFFVSICLFQTLDAKVVWVKSASQDHLQDELIINTKTTTRSEKKCTNAKKERKHSMNTLAPHFFTQCLHGEKLEEGVCLLKYWSVKWIHQLVFHQNIMGAKLDPHLAAEHM